MKKYSEEQLNAIKTTNNHTAVIAGAGSGKTTVLIARINEILDEGINAEEILAITFTRKAANEMVLRIKNKNVLIKTFDAFCYDLVLNYYSEEIKIIENSPFSETEITKFNNYDVNLKRGLKPLKYDEYVKFKETNNLYDFNDIEYLALDIIKKHKITFKHILIDEFQDTNELQYRLFKFLIKDQTKTFVVGDPDQSIYGFRGANFRIIAKYIKEYEAKTLILSNNYRSTKEILISANSLISNNKYRIKKELIPITDEEGKVVINNFLNETYEYEFIIKQYNELKEEYKSFAILYRNNYQGTLYRKYFQDLPSNMLVTTIHQSKGLEFDVVFVLGVNEGVLPDSKIKTVSEKEEERRLLFVAITRAKKLLYVSSSTQAFFGGMRTYQKQSSFIKQLTPKVIVKKPKPKEVIKDTYEIGDLINHELFGEGTITEINKTILVIDFGTEHGIKKLLSNHPSITKK